MFKGLFTYLLLTSAEHAAALKNYTCPNYDDVAQPGVKPGGEFSLTNMTGDWYVLATSEPTLPFFCKCSKSTWGVDAVDPVMKYHWKFATTCLGTKYPALVTTGESRDLTRPGNLMENAAILGHRIMPLTPELIYDYKILPDGNRVAFHYSCVDEPTAKALKMKRPFGAYVLARRPTISPSTVRSLLESVDFYMGGLLDIDGMHYTDWTKCGEDLLV